MKTFILMDEISTKNFEITPYFNESQLLAHDLGLYKSAIQKLSSDVKTIVVHARDDGNLTLDDIEFVPMKISYFSKNKPQILILEMSELVNFPGITVEMVRIDSDHSGNVHNIHCHYGAVDWEPVAANSPLRDVPHRIMMQFKMSTTVATQHFPFYLRINKTTTTGLLTLDCDPQVGNDPKGP